MNIYRIYWKTTFKNEPMFAEVYASSKETALEGLGLDSMEWSTAKVTYKPMWTPTEGEIRFIKAASDDPDEYEEEWS